MKIEIVTIGEGQCSVHTVIPLASTVYPINKNYNYTIISIILQIDRNLPPFDHFNTMVEALEFLLGMCNAYKLLGEKFQH